MLQYDRIVASKGIDINKKVHQKNIYFVIIGILKMLVINFNHIFVMVAMFQW